jgi:hypothetical protein
MIRSAIVAATASVVMVVAPASAAAHAPAAKSAPNACKTFASATAATLFGVAKSTKVSEKQTRSGSGSESSSTCTTTAGKHKLTTNVSLKFGGFGGPFKCYDKPKLGPDGKICVSTVGNLQSTIALFSKGDLFVADTDNVTLPKHGKQMYVFALAQRKHH